MSNNFIKTLVILKILTEDVHRRRKYNAYNPLTYVFLAVFAVIVGTIYFGKAVFELLFEDNPFKY